MGLLQCSGPSTVTGMIRAAGRDQQDWSADYRVFSRARFDPNQIFAVIIDALLTHLPEAEPVVIPLDDTNLRKSGLKIPGVAYRRDPMSPRFRTNLVPAQRFIQASISVPLDPSNPEASRAFPICIRHAPSVPRPHRNADFAARAEYRKRCRQDNLSVRGVDVLRYCRAELDRQGGRDRTMIACVDGSYTNRTVLRNIPERTTLIGRIRGDAKLFHPPTDQPSLGRRRSYGSLAPTPEQLRGDETVEWQTVRVWASGALRECQLKTIGPVLTSIAGPGVPVRLIVIRPLGYRLTKSSRVLYRKPAYLICTSTELNLEQAVQAYFRRWDIEVNHRDEKQLIGLGQAQVRSPHSAERVPMFTVAIYSLLLLAAAQTYGFAETTPPQPVPLWRSRGVAKQTRLTSGQILEAIRHARPRISRHFDPPNFADFETHIARHLKCPKSAVTHQRALEYAMYPS